MRYLKLSLLFLMMLFVVYSPAQTQDENTPFRIGRGDVESVQWHPKGLYVMVSSVTGAWIYTDTLEDVTHIPDLQLASITPDGKYITGTVDGQMIQFWDALTFEFVKEQATIFHQITKLVWSPDSHHIAVAGKHGLDFVQIYNFDDEAIGNSKFYAYSEYVSADFLSWNRTGQYLAMMDMETAEVRVWDVYAKSLYFQDKPTTSGWSDILEWSGCNHLVRIQGGEYPITTFWDIDGGQDFSDRDVGWDTAFSSRDCSYITANAIHDVYTDNIIANIGDSFHIYNPTWSTDGHIVTFSSRYFNGNYIPLQLFDVVQEKYLDITALPRTTVSNIFWHPWESYFVALGINNELYAYYVDEDRITGSQNQHASVSDIVEWNPIKSELAIANPLDGVIIWDIKLQEQKLHYPNGFKSITGLMWQPNGQYLATYVVNNLSNYDTDPTIVLYDTLNEGVSHSFVLPDNLRPTNIDWHPTEPQLAIASRSSKAHIWDVDSQKFIHEVETYYGGTFVGNIQWSHDGQSIAVPESSSGNGGSILLHNIESSESIYVASAYATSWSWSSDNELVWFSWDSYGCGGYSPPITEPNIHRKNWEQSAPLVGMTNSIARGFVSPNGTYGIALDKDGNGLIWELRTADVLAMLSDVKDLAWSEDEGKIAIKRHDNAIMIINPTGQILEYLKSTVSFAQKDRYAKPFGNLQWSADGQYLAHYHDGVIDVWTIASDDVQADVQPVTTTPQPFQNLSDIERLIISLLVVLGGLMSLRLLSQPRIKRKVSY